jgi:myo-inositol-1(or 4)-monophosphatase
MAIIPPVIVVMEKACRSAAKGLVRDFGELEKLQISKKDKNDFVSSSDFRASETISYHLQKDRPDYLQIDEETFTEKDFEKLKGDDCIFVFDPLDGTKNFIHGNGYFAVSIALIHRQEIIAGVTYNPISNELFWAHKGEGAWLNNQRLRVSQRNHMEGTLFASGVQIKHSDILDQGVTQISHMLKKTSVRLNGSAALDLAHVAAGKFDGYWERRLNLWDIAAGIILVREAGGVCQNEKGKDFDPLNDEALFASSAAISQEFLKNLQIFS